MADVDVNKEVEEFKQQVDDTITQAVAAGDRDTANDVKQIVDEAVQHATAKAQIMGQADATTVVEAIEAAKVEIELNEVTKGVRDMVNTQDAAVEAQGKSLPQRALEAAAGAGASAVEAIGVKTAKLLGGGPPCAERAVESLTALADEVAASQAGSGPSDHTIAAQGNIAQLRAQGNALQQQPAEGVPGGVGPSPAASDGNAPQAANGAEGGVAGAARVDLPMSRQHTPNDMESWQQVSQAAAQAVAELEQKGELAGGEGAAGGSSSAHVWIPPTTAKSGLTDFGPIDLWKPSPSDAGTGLAAAGSPAEAPGAETSTAAAVSEAAKVTDKDKAAASAAMAAGTVAAAKGKSRGKGKGKGAAAAPDAAPAATAGEAAALSAPVESPVAGEDDQGGKRATRGRAGRAMDSIKKAIKKVTPKGKKGAKGAGEDVKAASASDVPSNEAAAPAAPVDQFTLPKRVEALLQSEAEPMQGVEVAAAAPAAAAQATGAGGQGAKGKGRKGRDEPAGGADVKGDSAEDLAGAAAAKRSKFARAGSKSLPASLRGGVGAQAAPDGRVVAPRRTRSQLKAEELEALAQGLDAPQLEQGLTSDSGKRRKLSRDLSDAEKGVAGAAAGPSPGHSPGPSPRGGNKGKLRRTYTPPKNALARAVSADLKTRKAAAAKRPPLRRTLTPPKKELEKRVKAALGAKKR